MDQEGKTGLRFMVDGLPDFTAAREDPKAAAKTASFDTKSEADSEALKFGWTVRDDEGPNHRCPECAAKLRH